MTDATPSVEQSRCAHRKAAPIRNGTLMRHERLMPFDEAWCPCGAFRESSATKDPEPWQLPERR